MNNTTKKAWGLGAILLTGVLGIGGWYLFAGRASGTRGEVRVEMARTEMTEAKVDLPGQREPARQRGAAGESKETAKPERPPLPGTAEEPLTRSQVLQARYLAALRQYAAGETEAALAELRACYREEAQANLRRAIRSTLANYAKTDPRARQVLAEVRDELIAQMREDGRSPRYVEEFAALNAALGDEDITVRYFDELPESDPRKRLLNQILYPTLVAQGRYEDAARVTTLDKMLSETVYFAQRMDTVKARIAEALKSAPPPAEPPAALPPAQLPSAFTVDIDLLAGMRRHDDLAIYLTRLLELDRSGTTLPALRQHLAQRPEAAQILEDVVAVRAAAGSK